ncbi:MAG: Acetyltransferase, family [Gemmatimonadetes bacterium]|nr:Acetyltransferase, family [Gemmatimonadota bacterium]
MSHSIPPVALRPVRDDDRDFLFGLYASTRAEELAPVPWTEEQKTGFLLHQFNAQTSWWTENYVGATFDVIEVEGERAGRLYVHRTPAVHAIVDIALLPRFRGRGLGTHLLEAVIAEAEGESRSVRIHVEMMNPARRLYARMGFVGIEDKGVYLLMERAPRAPGPIAV